MTIIHYKWNTVEKDKRPDHHIRKYFLKGQYFTIRVLECG